MTKYNSDTKLETFMQEFDDISDDLTILEYKLNIFEENKNMDNQKKANIYEEICQKISESQRFEQRSCTIDMNNFSIIEINNIVNNLKYSLEPKLYFVEQTYFCPYYVFISW
jgi:hypothetical protein